jgi:D-3-phosphoglycerate dehydrogenase
MKTHTGNILIAAPVHPVLVKGFTDLGYTCTIREKITQSSSFDLVADCAGIITSTRLQLNKELIDAAPQLQWIGRMGSGGY